MILSIIVAVSKNFCIGKDNGLMWNLPADMAYFKKITSNGMVLMGRKTFLSIPEKFRPLPNRMNIVVSKDEKFVNSLNSLNHPNIKAFDDLNDSLEFASSKSYQELFIIGGADIYRQTMDKADKLYVTLVDVELEGDAYFPKIDSEKWRVSESFKLDKDEKNIYNCEFITYLKK